MTPREKIIREAFETHDRRVIRDNIKLGCLLGFILMPVGVLLDWIVYPSEVSRFLYYRLLCSALIAVFWLVVAGPVGYRYPRQLGVVLASFPSFFISLMIYVKDGAASPYYAGLNLVLLVIGFVLYWGVVESVVSVSLVLFMYLAACVLHGPVDLQAMASNLYFLILTGIIVVAGSHAHSRWRLREFTVRYELDERTRELEATLRKLREAEAQLLQQEKMASLGVMSAGIIHEINNPLNFAATSLFALRKKARHLPADQQADYQEALAEVEEGLTRVKNIVSDLRLFTHPNAEAAEDVDVAEALDTAVRLLAGELKPPVRLERSLPPGLTVRASRNKLVHVLINLLQNALDALRRKPAESPPPTIRIEGRAEGGRVRVTVEDNGPGVRPEDQPRVFDPFFTTKDVGEGMGLGLSICYRLMREFHGDIRLESEPGRYCRFTLEFPAAPMPTPAAS